MNNLLKVFILLATIAIQSNANASNRANIWPSIPFLKGANLCNYSDAFGQTRSEYMNSMVGHARDLMESGALGNEALDLLVSFNGLYDRNQALATRGKYLDVTLESTLKSYLSSYYRKLQPRNQNISFKHTNKLVDIVSATRNGQRPGYINDEMIEQLDFIAYGSYSYAPNCRGNIVVTLHLVGRSGETTSYQGTGKPSVVMSQIASKIFEDFQRTKFPSKLKLRNKTITLISAPNGSIGTAYSPRNAAQGCEMVGGRLPTSHELEMIDLYGDWSGGVSIGNTVWALPNDRVYHPGLRNPSPVRRVSEVNDRSFKYYCVR